MGHRAASSLALPHISGFLCITTTWELRGYKRKPGRPKKNWLDVIKRNLREMDLTSEEAKELANDKQNGIHVWPNAAIWMQDELRSKHNHQCLKHKYCYMSAVTG